MSKNKFSGFIALLTSFRMKIALKLKAAKYVKTQPCNKTQNLYICQDMDMGSPPRYIVDLASLSIHKVVKDNLILYSDGRSKENQLLCGLKIFIQSIDVLKEHLYNICHAEKRTKRSNNILLCLVHVFLRDRCYLKSDFLQRSQ